MRMRKAMLYIMILMYDR